MSSCFWLRARGDGLAMGAACGLRVLLLPMQETQQHGGLPLVLTWTLACILWGAYNMGVDTVVCWRTPEAEWASNWAWRLPVPACAWIGSA